MTFRVKFTAFTDDLSAFLVTISPAARRPTTAACWRTGNSSGYQRIIGVHFLCKGICSLLRRQQLARHSRMLEVEMGRRGMPDCSVSLACVDLNVSLYFIGLSTAEMQAARRNAQIFRA